MRFSLIPGILFVILLVLPQTVRADSIKIEPAFIEVEMESTESAKEFVFTITNNSDKELSIDLSGIDFRQSDDPYGNVSFLGKEIKDYTYGLTSFISFTNNNLELKQQEKREINVTIANRQDLSPGGHYGAVIVRQRPGSSTDNTIVTPALSSLVYLTKKGGERYNLSFKDVDFPKIPIVFAHPSTYFILLQNDGNVHLTPYGRADITDIFGRLIYKGIINENSLKVLPKSRKYIPVYSKKVSTPVPISINKISIQGRDSLDKTKFSYQDYFLYINPVFGTGVIIGLIILVLIWLKKRKTKNLKLKTTVKN